MTSITVLIIIGLVILAFVLGYIISNQIRNNQGRTILVPADLTDIEFQKYFPDLMGQTLRLLTPRSLGTFKPSDRTPFESHLEGKFGNKDCLAADLSVLVRDRTKSPALIPVDVKLETELLSIYKSSETPDAEKVTVAEAVRSRLQNIPDLYERTTVYRVEDGRKKYHYFPRIQVEFSSRLLSPSPLDSLAYLGMVIVIKDDDPARFVDYQPKAADIVEFTRGQLTLENQLQAKASPALEQGISDKIAGASEAAVGSSGKKSSSSETTDSRKSSISPELSFTLSESYLNELKESIEARTSGILNNGRVFFADFRAIKEKRIGGTYSFDLMLEIPSKLIDYKEVGLYSSEPESNEVRADAYLVTVVRHVADRGYTGLFTQVPDPEYDTVFHQVITKKEPGLSLWTFGGVPWGDETLKEPPAEFTVKVITNRNDASFVVKSVEDGSILGRGSGNMAEIKLLPVKTVEVLVEFLDIVVFDQGKSFVLKASPSEKFTIEGETSGEVSVVGNYNPI